MFKLVNSCQNYLWGKKGSNNFVYKFAQAQEAASLDASQPYAEYWIGCHPKSFSSIIVNGEKVPLASYLKAHSLEELPYLFKVLSIDSCLSLQSHPPKGLAKLLHQKDPKNYPDENHKPEMAVTLTDFKSFCNFCPKDELIANFKKYNCVATVLKDKIANLEAAPEGQATKDAFKDLFLAINTLPKSIIQELRQEVEKFPNPTVREEVLKEVIQAYPDDLSVVATLAFNILQLPKGKAFVMAPREPHSYISGEIVEVMALSDNVVRLGLTPKFKDYDTLVHMLTWEMGKKELVKPETISKDGLTCTIYCPHEFEEFQCALVQGKLAEGHSGHLKTDFHSVIANFGEPVTFSFEDGKHLELKQFETAFLLKNVSIKISSHHEVFFAVCSKNHSKIHF